MKIDYNQLLSYKKVAQKFDNPQAAQTVGRTNNRNQLAIVIASYRVIGSDSCLVGYAGGLTLKQKLIELEQNNGGYYG